MNSPADLEIARTQHWYRIPVSSVERWLSKRWPPDWLGFYQTQIFGEEAYGVRYYARVLDTRTVRRRDLLPSEFGDPKADRLYHQVMLTPLLTLPMPIESRRWRRITFIPTTWGKLWRAREINDLYDESPLEDELWAHLRSERVPAERQFKVTHQRQSYMLDFAVFCQKGQIDIEADGDSYHLNPRAGRVDNARNNDLESAGWHVLRFDTVKIRHTAASECLPMIRDSITRLGGINEGAYVGRKVLRAGDRTVSQQQFQI